MFYLDWMISLVVLGVYPFAVAPIVTIARRVRRNSTRTQAELGGMTSLLAENLGATRLIKSFRLEEFASNRVSRSFEDVFRLKLKGVQVKARLESLLEALGGLAVAGVIWVAYWRISSGAATVGDFMGLTAALLMAAQPLKAIGGLMARLQEGLAAIESIYGILDEEPKNRDLPGAKPLVLGEGGVSVRPCARSTTATQHSCRHGFLAFGARVGRRLHSSGARVPANRRSSIWCRGCST